MDEAEAMDKPTQVTLNIFLIKKGIQNIQEFVEDATSLSRHAIQKGNTNIGELFVQKSYPHPPSWGKFFKEYLDPRDLGSASAVSAVLAISVDTRWFALTFGHGRFLLKPESWEEHFGLLVTLNSVAQDRIKSMDKRTFDAMSTQSKVQTSQDASPKDFGLDVEQDLVRAVTGTPNERALGNRMSGMDALRVHVSAKLEDVPDLLRRYLQQFGSKEYKKNFPWVDHISEVTRQSQKDELDELLITNIRSMNLERCWLAVPDIVEWGNIDGFRFGLSPKHPKHHDIHLDKFLEEVRAPKPLGVGQFKSRQVHCFGEDDLQLYQWSVYKCLYCELDKGNESFLLTGGKWYRVTRGFVAEVNDSFARIPRYTGKFPEYDDDSETLYNERVAASDPQLFALMDRKLIQFGGPFEFCDLYTTSKDIIHVKRYGGSSLFSHLFSQGTVSGEMFVTQPEFRFLVNEKLPVTYKFSDSERRPSPDEFQVVFAVVSDSVESDLTIPFFSRLNLRAAMRRLKAYGYRVAIAKITVSASRSKLKRYDAGAG